MLELKRLDLFWEFYSPITKLNELGNLIRAFGKRGLEDELLKGHDRILLILRDVLKAIDVRSMID